MSHPDFKFAHALPRNDGFAGRAADRRRNFRAGDRAAC
jgi:hypothetical protein